MSTTTVSASPVASASGHPLRNRNFRLLFTGSTISLLGDQFYFVALPWLVLQQTGSAIAVGTIMMFGAIPRTVLMLMGGAISDRISPRKILITSAWVRTACVTAIGLLVWFHTLQIWELYALAAAFGAADAFDAPAGGAFLPFLLEEEQLVAAVSVTQTGMELTSILGPVPAGFVVKALGLAWAFLIEAVSFLFIIGALVRLPEPPPSPSERQPIWHAILEGIQYVWRDIPLRSVVLVAVSMNFCLSGPIEVGLAYLVKTKFGSPAVLGLLLSALAIGSLCGVLLAGIWKIKRRGIMVLFVSLVLALLLGSMGLPGNRWTFATALLGMGVTAGLGNVHIGAWTMQRIDATVRGRVSSVLILSSVGIVPVSLAVAALMIAVSLKFMFLFSSFVLLLVTVAAAMQETVRQIE